MDLSNKTLIIVNGFPRSGKDTFMDYYGGLWKDTGLVVKKNSTIDTVKRHAGLMGWDGTKTPKNREMLSELKDFYTEYFDGPLNEIKYHLLCTDVDMLLVAMREPAEITKTYAWAAETGVNCQTYLIRGKNEEIDHNSHSDAKVLEYDYGLTFDNSGELQEFYDKIEQWFNYMLK